MDKRSVRHPWLERKLTELKDHVEYRQSDLDFRSEDEQDELGLIAVVFGWLLFAAFFVSSFVAFLLQFAEEYQW